MAITRKMLNEALRDARATGPRPPRRTGQEAAAERIVDAIAALLDSGDVDEADRVAFEDARAAAEKYRQA
jgi:hypothetical protein